jgi:hypothetical protein
MSLLALPATLSVAAPGALPAVVEAPSVHGW